MYWSITDLQACKGFIWPLTAYLCLTLTEIFELVATDLLKGSSGLQLKEM